MLVFVVGFIGVLVMNFFDVIVVGGVVMLGGMLLGVVEYEGLVMFGFWVEGLVLVCEGMFGVMFMIVIYVEELGV